MPGDFPLPSPASLARTAEVLAALPADRPALVDGLAFGAVPDAVLRRATAPLVVLLHHPLGLETGHGSETAERLIAAETVALTHARAVLVPSRHVAAILRNRFGVPSDAITVAPPGTLEVPPASRLGVPQVILSVGTVTPRKGHDVLVAALAGLADLPWTARFVGSTDRDPDTVARLHRSIADAGLVDRIVMTGAADDDRLLAEYSGADLFALASRFEGYGMVFAEALAAGLPIVATAGGATPDLVPPTAGLLSPPGDADALRASLAAMLTDRARADRMAAAARAAGARLPRWPDTARIVKAVLDAALLEGAVP